MRSILVLLAVGAIVAGCAPSAERLSDRCEGFGYSPGSDAFLRCIQGEEQVDAINRARGDAMLDAGVRLMQGPSRYVFVPY